MKHIAGVLIAFALLFGASMLAVQRFDDRETFVSPPDSVAEAFIREVLTRRWDRANSYLAEPASREDLEELQERLGEPQNVESEIAEQHKERAVATVTLKSGSFDVRLVWHEGEWKVVALPFAEARALTREKFFIAAD